MTLRHSGGLLCLCLRLCLCLSLCLLLFCVSPSVHALTVQEVIDKAKPSVAHISVLGRNGTEKSSGSGFVVSNDGKLITNHHVVSDAEAVVAVFDGDVRIGVVGVVAFDAKYDLVVLQLEESTRPPLELSQVAAMQGQEIVVIGSPKGFRGTASTGIVSAIRSEGVSTNSAIEESQPSWQLQVTAPISPGSSGSPILSESGQVLGVAVGAYSGQALHFGIPAAFARELLQRVGPPEPVTILRTGRSVATNLLISAVGLASAIAIGWFVAWGLRLRTRRAKTRVRLR